jgi:hypothetical protein
MRYYVENLLIEKFHEKYSGKLYKEVPVGELK